MNIRNNQSPPSTGVAPELSGNGQPIQKRSGTSSNDASPLDERPRYEPSTSDRKSVSSSHDEILGTGTQNEASRSFFGLSVAATNSPDLQNADFGSRISTSGKSITERSAVLSFPVKNQDELMRGMLADAFTNKDTTNAERLIFTYGAYYLSSCTCSFTFGNRTYPDITPFALACRAGKLDIVKRLYVDPKQLNQTFECSNGINGRTALMLAVMHGHIDVVEQLLRWEADPQLIDQEGNGVDSINFVFNNHPVSVEIDKLLTQYRREHNLPQHKSILLKIDTVREANDESVRRFYRVPDGNNCTIL